MTEPQAVARRTDPGTSHEAARSVRVPAGQQIVLDILRRIGPATDEEIWDARSSLHVISQSGARTRRRELVDAGLVEDTGQVGLTRAGRRTIVWAVTS